MNQADSLLHLPASPEMVLAITCIQSLWQPNEPRLRSCLEAVTNWQRFLYLAYHHQILPIIYRVLSQANLLINTPEAIQQKLLQRSQYLTQHNLQLTAETLHLLTCFQGATIRAIPLKGTLLAAYLYGNKALRQVRDIDILIEPHAYPQVKRLLEGRGYRPEKTEIQSWSTPLEQLYLQQQGEINWWHEQLHISVDIHLRLCRNPESLPLSFEHVWQTAIPFSLSQAGSLNNQRVPTLSAVHQALFLSVHGANHQWSRLLWLTDIALLTQQSDQLNLDWQPVLDHAEMLGVLRSVGQGLQLAQTILGAEIPTPWLRCCQTRSVQTLTSISLAHILHQQDFEPPGTLATPPLSLLRIYQELRYTTRLKTNWRYKLSCLTRLLFTAKDWKVVRLPSYLWFLYIPLRPFLYSYRWFRHRFVDESSPIERNPHPKS